MCFYLLAEDKDKFSAVYDLEFLILLSISSGLCLLKSIFCFFWEYLTHVYVIFSFISYANFVGCSSKQFLVTWKVYILKLCSRFWISFQFHIHFPNVALHHILAYFWFRSKWVMMAYLFWLADLNSVLSNFCRRKAGRTCLHIWVLAFLFP